MLYDLLDVAVCASCWQAETPVSWQSEEMCPERKVVLCLQLTITPVKYAVPYSTHIQTNCKWKQLHQKAPGLFVVLLSPPSCQVIWRISLSCSFFFLGEFFFSLWLPSEFLGFLLLSHKQTLTHKHTPDASPLPGALKAPISLRSVKLHFNRPLL